MILYKGRYTYIYIGAKTNPEKVPWTHIKTLKITLSKDQGISSTETATSKKYAKTRYADSVDCLNLIKNTIFKNQTND